MINTQTLRQQWFGNIRGDVLSGLVVALALIPEAIAFSIIAGVDPKIGLYASFCIAVVIAFAGGRPAMISAATGAMALVMVDLVADHGLQYLLVATLLTGVLQFLAGVARLPVLMRFVSRSVITGFVNALAILIFMAQLPQLVGVSWMVYPMVAGGLAIIYLLPQVPLTLETLWIVLPVSATLAVVGLLESMLTAQIVDDLTDTPSDKNREARGQGIANVAAGLLGGMAGCAMIGQSVINVKSGGRGRLSTLVAGVFLLILVVFAGPWVARIPMAALVAVMIMVSIGTCSWSSIRDLRKHPPTSSVVMVATVVVTVATHDLAKGVLTGVLLSALFFARKVGQVLHVGSVSADEGRARHYTVTGQVFFASAQAFVNRFDFKEAVERVRIDVGHAHFWDLTAVGALDKVVLKFRREGTQVEVVGLNEASATLVTRLGVHDKPHAERLMGDH